MKIAARRIGERVRRTSRIGHPFCYCTQRKIEEKNKRVKGKWGNTDITCIFYFITWKKRIVLAVIP